MRWTDPWCTGLYWQNHRIGPPKWSGSLDWLGSSPAQSQGRHIPIGSCCWQYTWPGWLINCSVGCRSSSRPPGRARYDACDWRYHAQRSAWQTDVSAFHEQWTECMVSPRAQSAKRFFVIFLWPAMIRLRPLWRLKPSPGTSLYLLATVLKMSSVTPVSGYGNGPIPLKNSFFL